MKFNDLIKESIVFTDDNEGDRVSYKSGYDGTIIGTITTVSKGRFIVILADTNSVHKITAPNFNKVKIIKDTKTKQPYNPNKELSSKEIDDVVNKIKSDIYKVVKTSPEINNLHPFVKNKKTTDKLSLKFIDEVKDGRSPTFNTNNPLKLKGTILGNDDYQIKISNIKFNGEEDQESDSDSRYIVYSYILDVMKL
jgi:hypothetical protein